MNINLLIIMLVKIDGELMLVSLSFLFYILALTEVWYHFLSLPN